jgi:myo-inositol-1(or 4)-monophosphatase
VTAAEPASTLERRGSAFADELAFTIEVAERAGRLLAERYERVERIDYKSARDVVTEVDHLSEELILEAIRATFPGDALMAEESGEHDVAGRNRTWVIDPVDGTINYANGIPFFCVAIALVVDGRPAVGVIRDPMRDDTYAATSDGPATLGGRPISVSGKERLSDFVVSMALSGRAATARSRSIRRAVRITRSMGSAALSLAYVANGRFDAFVQQAGLSAWDVAAAGLIAERAGGGLIEPTGLPWFDLARGPKTVGVLAGPPAHLPELLRMIKG